MPDESAVQAYAETPSTWQADGHPRVVIRIVKMGLPLGRGRIGLARQRSAVTPPRTPRFPLMVLAGAFEDATPMRGPSPPDSF